MNVRMFGSRVPFGDPGHQAALRPAFHAIPGTIWVSRETGSRRTRSQRSSGSSTGMSWPHAEALCLTVARKLARRCCHTLHDTDDLAYEAAV